MSVEFIGFIANSNASETIVRQGPVLDPPYIETVAKAHQFKRFPGASQPLFCFDAKIEHGQLYVFQSRGARE